MRVRIPGWRSGLATLVLMAAAAAATYGALALLGVPGGSETEPAVARVPGVRDRLAICVDVYDPAGELGPAAALLTAAKKSVEAALEEVKRNPLWLKTAYSRQPDPIVDAGCPSPPAPALVTDSRYKPRLGEGQGPVVGLPVTVTLVERPSYYELFIFVASLSEIDNLLGGTTRREVEQEVVRVGVDVFQPVTGALYVTPEELGDVSVLESQVEGALGLRGSALLE